MLQKFILLIILTTLSFNSFGAEREFVNSVDDFYLHMHNHVSNVEIMADRLFEEIKSDPVRWRKYFKIPADVPIDNHLKKIITGFISVHDESKLNTEKSFLKSIKRETGLINDLYGIYAKDAKNMTPKQRSAVEAINSVDSNIREAYIKKNKLTGWMIDLIDDVEKITDKVERGMNPVTSEEMGRKGWKESVAAKKSLDKAIQDNLPNEQIQHLKERLELILKIEEEYPKHSVHYNNYRARMHKINDLMRQSGILNEYLDQFSTYRFVEEYEKFSGKKIDVNDPNITKNFKNYFFNTNSGKQLLTSSIHPSQQNLGNIMLELGQHEVNPASSGKWKNMFDTFQGVCH